MTQCSIRIGTLGTGMARLPPPPDRRPVRSVAPPPPFPPPPVTKSLIALQTPPAAAPASPIAHFATASVTVPSGTEVGWLRSMASLPPPPSAPKIAFLSFS